MFFHALEALQQLIVFGLTLLIGLLVFVSLHKLTPTSSTIF